MAEKERIDILLVEKGLIESREKAKAIIMSGQVYVNSQKVNKAGDKVDVTAEIEVRESLRYVSRGGLKLEKAIKVFDIDLNGKVCLDIGASTGGFTDCMLQNGAIKVYSIDVGYGQLAWILRQDSRVVSMERTNIRHVKPEDLDEQADFASIDVSFISLSKVLRPAKDLLNENAKLICLIKPQFEAGREKVGKKGVVRDPEVHKEVIENVINFAEEYGFFLKGLDFSPIKGPEGNIEYLAYLCREKNDIDAFGLVNTVVVESHKNLD